MAYSYTEGEFSEPGGGVGVMLFECAPLTTTRVATHSSKLAAQVRVSLYGPTTLYQPSKAAAIRLSNQILTKPEIDSSSAILR